MEGVGGGDGGIMMEKMPLNIGVTYSYSDIYSVNCLYCTGAFEPNGHLFCEYRVEKI